MSFSRAPLKRFNEHIGCAPAPGSYEIKPGELKGAASFHKSERFKSLKADSTLLLPPPSPSKHVAMSPVRRTMSVDGLAEVSSAKRERSGITTEMKQQRILEKQIRSLVQQQGEQDRRLLALEDDLMKAEAKLLVAVREKTGLSASVTTLERQLAELKKANEFLKNKVSADTTKKKINSLTMELMDARNNLDIKIKEISVLQINSEGQCKVLETNLQSAKATVAALTDKYKDLENLQQETKAQSKVLENETEKLNAIIYELREEIKVLQGYLDISNDQIQDLRMQLREKTELEGPVAESQQEKVGQLEAELQQLTTELQDSQEVLRQREKQSEKYQRELHASQDALRDAEKRLMDRELELKSSEKALGELEGQMKQSSQDLLDSQSTVRQQEAELARLREVLRRTEKELDERVAHLAQRCLFFEEERSRTQEEGFRRVEELKTELNSLKEVKREEKKKQIQLHQENAALTEELEKEKAYVDSLSDLLERERKESEEQVEQLKEEIEEVLGELAAMEEKDQRSQELVEKSQEAVQGLQQENQELERQLSKARTLLDSKSQELAAVEGSHFATMRSLQEENTNSLRKIGDITTELESTKRALKEAEERGRELEAAVERVTKQMKEETDEVLIQREVAMKRLREDLEEQQQAQEKAREEHSRILTEAHSHLAQKDEEIKDMEASHMALVSQLREEAQLQKRVKEEALAQLEEQGGQVVTRLQLENEETQRRLETVKQEKGESLKQVQQEREENARLLSALDAQRIDSLQGKAEVLRLQGQLEKVDGERRLLNSQVELVEKDRLALQCQLRTAESDGRELQSHLDQIRQEDLSLRSHVALMEEQLQEVEQEAGEQRRVAQALQEQVEVLAQEKVTLQWEMEEQRRELEKSSSSSETEHWMKKYEDLFSKVKPFQEQLNGFAAERNALLNENGANQDELNKLADAYARLLGHQNQRQKIKHVVKLKDENIALKQEVTKLQSQVNRHRMDLDQLRSKLPGAPRRRFDPSKAFQHDSKENRQPESPSALSGKPLSVAGLSC